MHQSLRKYEYSKIVPMRRLLTLNNSMQILKFNLNFITLVQHPSTSCLSPLKTSNMYTLVTPLLPTNFNPCRRLPNSLQDRICSWDFHGFCTVRVYSVSKRRHIFQIDDLRTSIFSICQASRLITIEAYNST